MSDCRTNADEGCWNGIPFPSGEVARAWALYPDLEDLMDYLVGEVRQLLGADAFALLLPDEESSDLAFCASSGWRSDPVAEQRRVPADERSGAGLAMRTQQLLQVEDTQAIDLDLWTSDWLREVGHRSSTRWPSTWREGGDPLPSPAPPSDDDHPALSRWHNLPI